MNLNTTLTLHTEKPIHPTIGDCVIKDNECTIYTGDQKFAYTNAADICTTICTNKKYELLKPKICECCGAPVSGIKCEYCDVEYNFKEVYV